MRRRRFQKGSVRPRKHGRRKVWVAQWWDNGCKRSKVLGPCSEISKGHAEVMMAQILEPVNDSAGHPSTPAFTFKQYVESVFLPTLRKKWKESTRTTSEADILRYLVPAFKNQVLDSITREQMQAFLDQKAPSLSQSVVGHLRWHLNAIFKMAQSDGAVSINPAAALYIPACKQSEDKRAMTKDEVRLAISILNLRERLVLRLGVFEGMRPGEIFAVRIGKLGTSSVEVDERVYGSKLDSPKGRKGRRTARTVGLSPGTAADLVLWRAFIGDQPDEAFLFASENPESPIRPNNLWKREIRPRLQKVGLGWVNFQVLRRTNASLSRKSKVDDKVSADQRGHGLGVSLGVYAISDLEQKIEAVTRLESDVIQDLDSDILQ
jgi:integrase